MDLPHRVVNQFLHYQILWGEINPHNMEKVMKKSLLSLITFGLFSLGIPSVHAAENQEADMMGITKALNNYIEAAIKGDSSIAKQSFAPLATMSYAENGKLVTVPISALYEYFDKTGPHPASYTIETVKIAGNVAIVAIDSKFGNTSFDDMFTLVKDGDTWKIVSKIYHIK